MSKNRFSSSETVDIDLGDGDIITVKKSFSFKESADLRNLFEDKDPASFAFPFMKAAIVSWNLTDGVGPIPLTPENIEKLDTVTGTFLMEKLTELYTPEKKS